MAGHYPPPAGPYRPPPPPAAPPYGPPGQVVHPYYYAPPRRPPQRSAGGAIVGIIGGLAALAVIAIVGLSVLGSLARQTTSGQTGSSGTTSGNSQTGAGVGAQSGQAAATNNKLYATGSLSPVGCRLPPIGPAPASMNRFMNTLSDCLDKSWSSQFAKAGISYAPPQRVFWLQSGRSPCGTYPAPGASAFYCPANNTMYVGLRNVVETSGGESLDHYAVFARVIAHEYGHHVQDRSGILEYGHEQMEQSGTAGRTEASRRIELQAQCLAGAFLGVEAPTLPMTRDQYVAMVIDVQGRGDERQPVDKRDHGSGRNYAGWVIRGYQRHQLTYCNTWTATPSMVN
ncbi:neutral zinc metallopeptidase [Actinomadura barringtoniae]|uniref:Neutral zinc metallopeptidase n=1 Tax=Actinomadura barringtoniae TaxID=1427535 RepID=A0A939TFY4_9ACTN|nr:neutral zinc metallopeptidase [Actinomadura barringtoniae]MBO2454870.1 neutral zinc metallopeptidase [Actinomadura barringtoniae]